MNQTLKKNTFFLPMSVIKAGVICRGMGRDMCVLLVCRQKSWCFVCETVVQPCPGLWRHSSDTISSLCSVTANYKMQCFFHQISFLSRIELFWIAEKVALCQTCKRIIVSKLWTKFRVRTRLSELTLSVY